MMTLGLCFNLLQFNRARQFIPTIIIPINVISTVIITTKPINSLVDPKNSAGFPKRFVSFL